MYIICGAMVHYSRIVVQKIMYMHNAPQSRLKGLGSVAPHLLQQKIVK